MNEVPYKSIPDMLRSNAAKFQGRLALKYRKQGAFVTLTYAAYYERALMVARGLVKMGVKPGDRIAILSENRAGWVIADMGILCTGSATVPIYPTNTPEQIEYMINHSGARIVFVSGKFQYSKLLMVREAMPGLELVVSFERFLGDPKLPVTTFYQLSEIDSPITPEEKKEIEAEIDRIEPGDMLTLIYTSGTTGIPKGVMLSHNNILTNTQYLTEQSGVITENEVLLSFLPLSHILERTTGYYMTIRNGCLMAFADSIEKVPDNMMEIRPTIMVSVPRLFEKIYAKTLDQAEAGGAFKTRTANWSFEIARQYGELASEQKEIPGGLKFKHKIADKLVLSKWRAAMGGRIRLLVSGGAPLSRQLAYIFYGAGLPIYEGYGLTESAPTISVNYPAAHRLGSVGKPAGGVDVRIAEDGEILAAGPNIMLGYYNRPDATAEALTTLQARPPIHYLPKLLSADGGVYSLYEADAGYADEDVTRAGARDRLVMLPSGWRYERS